MENSMKEAETQKQEEPKNYDEVTYDVPECPICFETLTSNLASAQCGHVLHLSW